MQEQKVASGTTLTALTSQRNRVWLVLPGLRPPVLPFSANPPDAELRVQYFRKDLTSVDG